MESKDQIVQNLKKSFRILRRNYGCPGNDGISIQTIKSDLHFHIDCLANQILNNNFEFERSPKSTTIIDYLGNPRSVMVYNMYERWLQEYIRTLSQDIIDSFLSNHVYGYRRKKKDIEAYKYILESSPRFILRLDIRNFFGAINREYLFKMLYEIGLDAKIIELIRKSFESFSNGLPQGHVMSPLLSNFYLHKFDSNFPESYTRYADDMIFRLEKREDMDSLLKKIESLLEALNLKLNEDKTILIENPTLAKLT